MNRKLMSVIALGLALLAALTMFIDGVSLTNSYLKQYQDELNQYLGMAAYGGDIIGALSGLSGEQSGVFRQQMKLYTLLVGAMKSGGFSVWEAFRVLSSITVIYFKEAAASRDSAMSFNMSDFDDDALKMTVLPLVLLFILLLGAALALVLSTRNLVRGKRNGSLLMVFVTLLALAMCIALVEIVKATSEGLAPLSITLWPVVGLVLAIGGAVVGRLNPAGAMASGVGKGRGRSAGSRPKPATPSGGRRCPGCGKVYGPETVFCGVCGTRLDSGAEKAPSSAFCPHCGAPTKPGQRFCGKCGGTL